MAQDKSTLFVWGVTGLLALGMIGGAGYVALKNRQDAKNAQQAAQAVMPQKQQNPFKAALQKDNKTAPEPAVVAEKQEEPAKTVTAQNPLTLKQLPPISPPATEEQDEPSLAPERPMTPRAKQEKALNEQAAAIRQMTENTPLPPAVNTKSSMTLSMNGLNGERHLPLTYTCYRRNISPRLSWSNPPAGTKSYVLVLQKQNGDDDGQIYWALFDIPAGVNAMRDAVPKQPEYNGMRQAKNDFGNAEYTGPCDPKGKFNYVFRLFALDIVPDLPAAVPNAALIRTMNGHVLGEAQLPVLHYFRL